MLISQLTAVVRTRQKRLAIKYAIEDGLKRYLNEQPAAAETSETNEQQRK